jgi:ArsR family transcriptional regulator, arsenate/arsenite/antimonite-responsive transcriptional repressor
MNQSTMAGPLSVGQLTALADPTRLAILNLLRKRDHCVCHFVEVLQLKQSVISHHIGILRRAGLIGTYPHPTDRRWLYYRLNRAAIEPLYVGLQELLDETAYNPVPLPCAADTDRWKDELLDPKGASR